MEELEHYGGYISIGSSGFVNGVQMIVNNGLYTELTGKSVYEEILPVLKKDADRKAFDTTLEELSRQIPGTTVSPLSRRTNSWRKASPRL